MDKIDLIIRSENYNHLLERMREINQDYYEVLLEMTERRKIKIKRIRKIIEKLFFNYRIIDFETY